MESRFSRVSTPLLGALGFLVVACTPGRPYHPIAPHRGSAHGIDAEIVEVRKTYGFAIALKVRGEPDARVTRVLLAPAAAKPCREGIRDISLTVDARPQWLRPVALNGVHEVLIAFPRQGAEELLEQSPVLDFVLPGGSADDEACLRLPLSAKSPDLAWKRPLNWSANGALRWTFPSHPIGSVDDGWSIDIGMGRWIGPLRLRAELGAGTADCTGYCPPTPKHEQGFTTFPLRGAVDGYVFETYGFGIAAEVGYQLFPAIRRNPDDTARWENDHGPRVAIRLDVTHMEPPGWPSGGRQSSFGLEFSLARWTSSGNDDPALLWGIGFVNYFGF